MPKPGRSIPLDECNDPNTSCLPDQLAARISLAEGLRANTATPWYPFPDRWAAELAVFVYSEAELSEQETNRLLRLLDLIPGFQPPFKNYQHMLKLIDGLPGIDVPWEEATITPTPYPLKDELNCVDEHGNLIPPKVPTWWREVSF